MRMDERPRVGVGVIVMKDGRVLLGKRKGSHGAATWSFPGGYLEFGESPEDCAVREVAEETGIAIKGVTIETVTNDIFAEEEKHYITLFVKAEWAAGDVCVMEPEKCERWDWFSWDELPEPLFLPIQNLRAKGYSVG